MHQCLFLCARPAFDLCLAFASCRKCGMRFDEEQQLGPVVAGSFAGDTGYMIRHPLGEIESRTDVKCAGSKSQDVNGWGALHQARGH